MGTDSFTWYTPGISMLLGLWAYDVYLSDHSFIEAPISG